MLKREVKIQQGTSLLEVMMALIIITIGIIGYIKLHATFIGNATLAHQRIMAVQLAEDKMEGFRSYVTVNQTPGLFTYADIASGTATAVDSNTTYTTLWEVSENTNLGFKTITITVQWPRQDGTTESIMISSIINKYEPSQTGKVMQS